MTSISAPGAVRWIVRTLEDQGHETWTVGGAVRDLLAGLDSVDWDFATRARPEEVRRAFRRTVPIGIEHGTVGVLSRDGTLYEVTTFRKDIETSGRHAVVEYADRLEDDLSRRDFTINAVAWHPLRDEVRDPFGGVGDLEEGVLRTVGRPSERFAEDYLRILRALRFAGRFDLTVEDETWRALAGAVGRLQDLSPERIREELTKVLESDPRPSRSLGLYAASGALEVVYPELAALVGHPAWRDSEGPDAWTGALLAADTLPPHRPLLRLAALLLDVGEPERVPGGADHQGEGEEGTDAPSRTVGRERAAGERDGAELIRARGARRAAALLTRLRFSNAATDRIASLVRAGAGLVPAGAGGAARRRWLARVGSEHVNDVVRLAGARARVREAAGDRAAKEEVVAAALSLRRELRRRPPLTVQELALNGRDLIRMGLRPGPRFGEILDALMERVLVDPELDDAGTLERLVREEVAPELFRNGGERVAGSEGPDGSAGDEP